jgi:hypothetical protein
MPRDVRRKSKLQPAGIRRGALGASHQEVVVRGVVPVPGYPGASPFAATPRAWTEVTATRAQLFAYLDRYIQYSRIG